MNNMTVMNWGLSFQEEGKAPVIDVNKEFLEDIQKDILFF